VGSLDPKEPWLFREEEPPSDEPYVTSVLRTHLHDLHRGADGNDAPAVVYGAVRVGDAVTLVSDPALLAASFVTGSHSTALPGKTCRVQSIDYCDLVVAWSTFSCTLCWEAVVGHTRADVALALTAPPLEEWPSFFPTVGDYVLISSNEERVRRDRNWSPSVLTLLGHWARVTSTDSVSRELTVRLRFENEKVGIRCVCAVVPESEAGPATTAVNGSAR
jgi:hypothetical protein